MSNPIRDIETRKDYYVYHLVNPKDNLPFYVGKGCGNRLYTHVSLVKVGKIPNNNKHLYYKIRNILNEGESITYRKVYENLTELDALKYEFNEENRLRLLDIKLCNLAPCGTANIIGSFVKNKKWEEIMGIKKSLERKKRLIEWNKKFHSGLHHTQQTIEKIRQSSFGRPNKNKGLKLPHISGRNSKLYIKLEEKIRDDIVLLYKTIGPVKIRKELLKLYNINLSEKKIISILKENNVYKTFPRNTLKGECHFNRIHINENVLSEIFDLYSKGHGVPFILNYFNNKEINLTRKIIESRLKEKNLWRHYGK
jgi:hypothetical protein